MSVRDDFIIEFHLFVTAGMTVRVHGGPFSEEGVVHSEVEKDDHARIWHIRLEDPDRDSWDDEYVVAEYADRQVINLKYLDQYWRPPRKLRSGSPGCRTGATTLGRGGNGRSWRSSCRRAP